MDGKRKLKRKRVAGGPTLDEFHIILQQLQSPKRKIKFTESAVIGLREVYFEFMKNVASSLSQWDSLKGTSKVEEALGMNKTPEFEQWTEQSQKILSKKGKSDRPPAKKKLKLGKQLSLAEQERLEAEQNRLLQESKQKMGL